ncbi:MAG: PDZ domain-containing protein [Sedimentisphaerales bacterium]|nr:PDZ domain-containing protein [Sedimentisphaerales bacterium]
MRNVRYYFLFGSCARLRRQWGALLIIFGILATVRLLRPMVQLIADEWQDARTAVTARYQDESILEQTRTTDINQAHEQFVEILSLIDKHYYEPVSWRQVARQALLHLQAASQTSAVENFLHLTSQQKQNLQQQIDQIKAELANDSKSQWTTRKILDLTEEVQHLAQNSDGYDIWALIEWSYALAENLDGYSYLLSPRQYRAMQDRLGGSYMGIGVDLIIRGDYPRLFDVVQDGPAARAGLQPGDWIYAVNGVNCHQRDAAFVTALLTSAKSRSLELTLRRGQEEYRITVRSELLNAPCVRNIQTVDMRQKMGFLRISGFDFDTAMELRRGIDELTQNGIKGLIIDLRSNGGGVMNAAIESARLFLDSGKIVTVISGAERTCYCAGGAGKASDIPLALLVDANTASAAEIFVTALHDNHRAVVIGDKTFGKARIQTIFPLRNSSIGACITTAGYLPPGNQDFNNIGVTPDISIKNAVTDAEKPLCVTDLISDDNASLQTALTVLANLCAS